MDIIAEVELLQSRFLTATEIKCHLNCDGTTAQCCQTAHLTMESSLIASASKSGLTGVLDFLQSKLRWGMAQEHYYCDCLKADFLACGASTAVACWALEFYRDRDPQCIHSDHDYTVVSVQLIERCSTENAMLWRNEIKKRKRDNTLWICDSCNFHECIGMINNKTRELWVWDFGSWKSPYTSATSIGALQSVRLDTRCKNDPMKVDEYNDLMHSKVTWDGFDMQFEKWIEPPLIDVVSSHSAKEQKGIFGDVYSQPSQEHKISNDEATPMVYISGVQMGNNPCAGVGVARAIRAKYPRAMIVAVDDDGGCAAGGMCDPIFDTVLALAIMGGSYLRTQGTDEEKFEAACRILSANENAYYLPCRDQDVIAMARGHAALLKKFKKSNEQNDADRKNDIAALTACERILSPPQAAVDFSDKPDILHASESYLKDFFKIPEFMRLDPESTSWVEVQAFAERVGYPLVIKGPTMGCALCYRWISLSHYLQDHFSEGGFVQKHVYGSDVAVAFAACRGEMTGCIRMVKESYTDAGKVWDGGISPVRKDLSDAIEGFVKDCNWTGGGELEMIEDLSGNMWMIDFNVRFPAWIFASSFSGCNLPGNLIEHAMHWDGCHRMGVTECRSELDNTKSTHKPHVPYLQLPGKRLPLQSARASFTRSTFEIPRTNVTIERTMRLPSCPLSNHQPQNKGGRAALKVNKGNPIPILPALPGEQDKASDMDTDSWSREEKSCGAVETDTSNALSIVVTSMNRDLSALRSAAMDLVKSGPIFTPQRILCVGSVQESLERHQRIFSQAASEAHAIVSTGNEIPPVKMQLCLSVKTQPHEAVLAAAKDANYIPECISLAEAHAAMAVGFPANRVVLTGPGKFYDISGTNEPRPLPGALRAIFADSVADLKIIIQRVLDPTDWLDSDIIGVRWIPCWQVQSRFGLDPKDPKTVTAVAEIISTLPLNKSLGMHFHFAASTIGADSWFGLAQAFCHFSAGFSKLVNRPIEAIDFGGGWSPHFYIEDSGSNNGKLKALLQSVYTNFGPVQCPLPSVQFEPGKCISEAAGGVITRILDIREIAEGPTEDDSSKKGSEGPKAIIVDTCIAEISSPHIHPVFWRSKSHPTEDNNGWIPLQPGKNVVWGRTCMEFDLIHGTFEIPPNCQPGDFLLIAATGSYDFTNSYQFGDGVARQITLV